MSRSCHTASDRRREISARDSSSAKKRRNRLDAAARREQIVETAARLFSTQGFTATSMQDIMSEVGISGAAYYYYYSSKEDVLLEILSQEMQRVESNLELLEQDPSLSAAERLRLALSEHARTIAENRTTTRILFTELGRLPRPATRTIRSRMQSYTEELVELYRQGVSAGEFVPVDPRVAVNSLLGMATWVHHWFNPSVDSAAEVGRVVGDLATHGFDARNWPAED